jgi:hypothetical protein
MPQLSLDSLYAATRLLSEYCDAVAASFDDRDATIDRQELLEVLDFTVDNSGLKRAVDGIYRYLQQAFETQLPTWGQLQRVIGQIALAIRRAKTPVVGSIGELLLVAA